MPGVSVESSFEEGNLGGTIMSGISKDQRKRDEAALATFLLFFNLALLGAFLLICFYQYV
jgi:hypothetical protein